MKRGGCGAHKLLMALVLIGALNWGLVGGFDVNLVNMLLGSWEWLERLVYILVGLSALGVLVGCPCKKCKDMKGKKGMCANCK